MKNPPPLNPSDQAPQDPQASDTEAARIFAAIQPKLSPHLAEFVDDFFSALRDSPHCEQIFARLSAAEAGDLKIRQIRHLELILAPEQTESLRRNEAERIGRVHELAGINPPLLTRSYEVYHRRIRQVIATSGLAPEQQDQANAFVVSRLLSDISHQIESHYAIEMEIAALFAALDRTIQETSKLPDLLNGLMEALTRMDGLVACLFSRPDARGAMQIEAYGGDAGRAYAEALQSGLVPMFHISPDDAAGRGPAGRAWRSGQIQINEFSTANAAVYPWIDVGREIGFRASAAVPLLDEAGQPFAILSLYSSWPGFFGAPNRRIMLEHVQQAMSHAVRLSEQNKVIPVSTRRASQQLIMDGAVDMHYQPIINLRSGELKHVEALARLRQSDGRLLPPAAFLPALGRSGLLRLFQIGLDHVCRDLTIWQNQSPALRMHAAINLPSDGLIDDAYRNCVFETLARWSLDPSRLELEVLESQDPLDLAKRDARISEFRSAGVRIVQDDLGSGYSSLLRLDSVPFDAVKIDQGLVRSALEKPWRALGFIYHLTRLAHDLAIPVTVEGLEDEGLIEAAAILGADCGQGYGIARPMPAGELPQWAAHWAPRIDVRSPRTALGALAGLLLWDRHLATLDQWPERADRFVAQPGAVLAFLKHTTLPTGDLAERLARHLEKARSGIRDADFLATQQSIINRLAELGRNRRNA